MSFDNKPSFPSSEFPFWASEENYHRLDKLREPQRGNLRAMFRDAVSRYAHARADFKNPALEVRAACLLLENVMKAASRRGVEFVDLRTDMQASTMRDLPPREAAKIAYDMLRGNPDNLPQVRKILNSHGFVLNEKRLAGLEENLAAYREAFLKAVHKGVATKTAERDR